MKASSLPSLTVDTCACPQGSAPKYKLPVGVQCATYENISQAGLSSTHFVDENPVVVPSTPYNWKVLTSAGIYNKQQPRGEEDVTLQVNFVARQ